jgi:CheY-like chemotaxis protein
MHKGTRAAAEGPARLLIVDDDARDAEALRLLLAEDSHEVEIASSAEEAVQRFRSGTYHIVLADLVSAARRTSFPIDGKGAGCAA